MSAAIGLGIGMIVASIVAMVRGRLQLTNSKAVQGVWAYLLALGLMSALPVGLLVMFAYMAMNVDPNKPDEFNRWGQENELTLALIIAGVEIGVGIIVFFIGACMATPFSTADGRFARHERAYDDDFEGRPRRRRPADDEEDRPRRRDFEDDDTPRRRADDDYEGRRRDDLDERAR